MRDFVKKMGEGGVNAWPQDEGAWLTLEACKSLP